MGLNNSDRSGGNHVGGAPATGSRGNRGLWVALGALLAIIILAIGVVQVPKWLKTRAGESPVISQPAVEPPPPATTQSTAAATTSESITDTTSHGATKMQPSSVPAAAREEASAVRPAQRAAPYADAPQPQAPDVSAAADQMRAAELREIQRTWPKLASRAAAVATSLQNLQRAQQRQGFGLRGDISASWKRMEHSMDQADAAIAEKDATAAGDHLEDAEREIEILEKFLGR